MVDSFLPKMKTRKDAISFIEENQGGGERILVCFASIAGLSDIIFHGSFDTAAKIVTVTGQRLSGHFKEGCIAYHTSDEFIIILTLTQEDDILAKITEIQAALTSSNMKVDGKNFHVVLRIGSIVVNATEKTNPEKVLTKAYFALKQSKNQGTTHCEFSEERHSKQLEEAPSSGDLHTAFSRNGIRVHFQPQFFFNLKTRKFHVIAVEALSRLHDEELGTLNPGTYLDLANRAGLLYEHDVKVLSLACLFINPLLKRFKGLQVSVNFVPAHLDKPSFITDITSILTQHHFPTSNLEIELTEQRLHLTDNVINNLETLARLGISLAIDDIGNMNAGLDRISILPKVSRLKIEGGFVRAMGETSKMTTVKSIIALGRDMNSIVVAEGVEEKDQLKCLLKLGCRNFQGFLFSKPLTPEELSDFLGNARISRQGFEISFPNL